MIEVDEFRFSKIVANTLQKSSEPLKDDREGLVQGDDSCSLSDNDDEDTEMSNEDQNNAQDESLKALNPSSKQKRISNNNLDYSELNSLEYIFKITTTSVTKNYETVKIISRKNIFCCKPNLT